MMRWIVLNLFSLYFKMTIFKNCCKQFLKSRNVPISSASGRRVSEASLTTSVVQKHIHVNVFLVYFMPHSCEIQMSTLFCHSL